MKWIVLLLSLVSFSFGIKYDPKIGSNWSPYGSKKASSREASIEPNPSVNSFGVEPNPSLTYSTLPGSNNDPNSNYYAYQGDQSQVQGQGSQVHYPQPQPQPYYQPQQSQNQPLTQPQFAFPSSEGQQPFFGNFQPFEGGLQGFEGENNEIDESGGTGILGFIGRMMDRLGLGSIISGMSEVFQIFNGGSSSDGDESSGLSSSGGWMSRFGMPLMMIPMAALPLGMIVMSLMSFPVLQLTLPGIRRSMTQTATLTKDVLASEECMERFSCNLARAAKKIPYENWISTKLEKSENAWLHRVSKSLKAARAEKEECSQFSCSPVTKVQQFIRSVLLGDKKNTLEKIRKIEKSPSP